MENRFLCRGKRIGNGEWVEGFLVPFAGDDKNRFWQIKKVDDIKKPSISQTVRVNPSTICQCTGLKDKNGKLIWENDIVDGHDKRGAAFLNCLVLWNESKARFDVRAKGCNFPMTLDEVAGDMSVGGLDYEVVGNRFDNPELLELLEV